MLLRSIFISATVLLSQPIQAQECAQYHPLVKDYIFEMQHYKNGKKGKIPLGKSLHKVQQAESTTGTKAFIETVLISEKGKKGAPITYTVECNGGVVKIDTRIVTRDPNNDLSSGYEGDCFIELPSQPEVGMLLPECTFSCIDKNNRVFAKVEITDRKITGKETITIPAGTFEAFVIEYEMKTIYPTGLENIWFKKHHKDWYVSGKGFVKTESYRPSTKMIKNKYEAGDEPLFSSELVSFGQ